MTRLFVKCFLTFSLSFPYRRPERCVWGQLGSSRTATDEISLNVVGARLVEPALWNFLATSSSRAAELPSPIRGILLLERLATTSRDALPQLPVAGAEGEAAHPTLRGARPPLAQ